MKRLLPVLGLVLIAVNVHVACGDSGDGGEAGSGGAAGGSGGSGGTGGTGGTGGSGGTDTPTYTEDVQPILQAKCDPCHTVGASGGVNHAASYDDTQKSSNECSGKKVFECMLLRVQDGSMPLAGDCTGDPVQDADNDACLTAAEQDTLEAWVAAGAPE